MLDEAMGSLGLTFYTTNEAHVPHLLAWPLLLLLTSFNPPPCASSMRGLFMCGLTVVVIPSAGAAPAREEYNDYTEFFEVLGITDATKVSYLVKVEKPTTPHDRCDWSWGVAESNSTLPPTPQRPGTIPRSTRNCQPAISNPAPKPWGKPRDSNLRHL